MTSTFREPNPWTRRTLLGAGFVIATAGAAGVWRGIDTGVILPDQSPYDPWKEWTSSQSGDPLSLVSAAILAASPHNTQPWLFKVRDNTLSIYANEDRNLGAFDPYRREMWHGLGCAIANVEIAAPARGFATSTQLAPDPSQPMLAATITLSSPNGPLDPLVEMIVKRTTNRANYVLDKKPDATLLLQATPTETDTVRTIWVDANSVQGSAMIAQSIIATQNIIADKVMSAESYRWFRHSPRQVAKYRDGPKPPSRASTRCSPSSPLCCQNSARKNLTAIGWNRRGASSKPHLCLALSWCATCIAENLNCWPVQCGNACIWA
jgi:hypothetical protein